MVDVVNDFGLEVECVNVVEGAIELNLENTIIAINLELGLVGLLGLLEESNESTNEEANGTILEHADEPGDDKKPKFEFVDFPELSHNGLWHKSACGGDENGSNDSHWDVGEDIHEKNNNQEDDNSVDELSSLVSGTGLDIDVGTDEDTSAWNTTEKTASHVGEGHTEDFLGLVESGVGLVISDSGGDEGLKNSDESNLEGTNDDIHEGESLLWIWGPVTELTELNLLSKAWVDLSEENWGVFDVSNNFLHDDTIDDTEGGNDDNPWN